MTYKIKVGNSEFFLSKEDADALDSIQIANNKYHVIKDHKKWNLDLLEQVGKHVKISVNGNIYSVTIQDQKDLLVEKMGLSIGQTQKLSDIKAPMPGMILDIIIEKGQELKEGDEMLILEAMKMENVLTADGQGIVDEILVNKGETVEKGQILIKMA